MSVLPSMMALYHRSRYLRTSTEEVAGGRRGERERFTVAAMGFCLRHDPTFESHFLDAVLGQTDEKRKRRELSLEKNGIDLLLSVEEGDEFRIVAVEAKLGAGLAFHQNPGRDEFWLPGDGTRRGGYGRSISLMHPEATKVDFVLLGHHERIATLAAPPEVKTPWNFVQLDWPDLLPNYPKTSLSEDFASILASFGVSAFMIRQSDDKTVSSDLGPASIATEIMEHVCMCLSLDDTLWRTNNGFTEANTWYFGIDLFPPSEKRGDKEGNLRMLAALVPGRGRDPSCWFGYEEIEGRTVQSVWLYVGNPIEAKAAASKLSSSLGAFVPEDPGDCVVIRKPLTERIGDRDWFVQTFEGLGLSQTKDIR